MAAVKSAKTLLHKVLGTQRLTYEEYSTILCDIEATLNSRPLTPLDSMPPDGVQALTPGHFLVGKPLTAVPSRDTNVNRISNTRRWNLCQKLNQDFWTQWKAEYLTILNRYTKWKQPQRDVTVGDIVLLKDDELFSRSWPMARVVKVFPGKDGKVRVADVKTQRGTYRRPIVKLVVLLPHEEGASSTSPPGGCSGPDPSTTDQTNGSTDQTGRPPDQTQGMTPTKTGSSLHLK